MQKKVKREQSEKKNQSQVIPYPLEITNPLVMLNGMALRSIGIGLLAVLMFACSAKMAEPEPEASPNPPLDSRAENINAPEVAQRERDAELSAADTQVGAARQDLFSEVRRVVNLSPAAADEVVSTGSLIRSSPTTNSANVVRMPQESLPYYYQNPTDRENYLDLENNAIKLVSETPVSTFSIDVDTAGYSNLRRMLLREGRLPPQDAIRLEEMINYFDYDYQTPDSLDQPLMANTELAVSPWNPANKLLMIGIKGFQPELAERPASNLVFLVDVSGSMQSPDKLGLVKKSLHLLAGQMNADDRIALVVYAGAAGMVLDSTSAAEQLKISAAIDSLTAGGSTNGSAGIELAYRIAEANFIDGGINRVLIASDGDMNVGITDIDDLKELVTRKRANGIALTTLGFGTGNYNYSLMEQLADVGNGNAAYIDTFDEARKVLVEEMQSTLMTIAKDVKIQIEFNPAVVSEYRLLGYENRLLDREDFLNDKVDAGEIGAGHTVTALYEVSLTGSDGNLSPPTRYKQTGQAADNVYGNELAFVKIRYKLPDAEQSTEFSVAVQNLDVSAQDYQASDDIRFAAAVAGFGQLLSGGKYTNDWNYDQLLSLARESRGDDVHGYRSELLKMVEAAKVL